MKVSRASRRRMQSYNGASITESRLYERLHARERCVATEDDLEWFKAKAAVLFARCRVRDNESGKIGILLGPALTLDLAKDMPAVRAYCDYMIPIICRDWLREPIAAPEIIGYGLTAGGLRYEIDADVLVYVGSEDA
jgi:hypothetical protein